MNEFNEKVANFLTNLFKRQATNPLRNHYINEAKNVVKGEFEQLAAGKHLKDSNRSLAASVAAAPVRGVSNTIKRIFLGDIQTKGPMAGKRLRYAGLQPISAQEYVKLKSRKETAALAHRVKGGGPASYYQHTYGKGGIVGAISRNPGKVLAGGLATAFMLPHGSKSYPGYDASSTNEPIYPYRRTL